jgi:hypothetical protein
MDELTDAQKKEIEKAIIEATPEKWEKLGRVLAESIWERWERRNNPIFRPLGITRKDLEMSYLEKIEILSAPQNVEWVGYKPKDMNLKMYADMAKDKRKKEVEKLGDEIYLYSLPDKYVALDLKNQRIVYLVQFTKKKVFGKTGITQVQVWRDRTVGVTEGLAKKLFFDYLFPQADCIVTDKQQTQYGRAFCESRIYEAFGKGLPIYLLDQNAKTQTLLETSYDFDDLSDTWWGDDPRYQGRKIAVCHTKIW